MGEGKEEAVKRMRKRKREVKRRRRRALFIPVMSFHLIMFPVGLVLNEVHPR